MPEQMGKDIGFKMCMDSDHARYKSTLRPRTGLLIYINMTVMQWISKKQLTIETSVFGADFAAMNHGMETLRGLQY